MSFIDLYRAYREGCFGGNPRSWGSAEWSQLVDYLCGRMAYSQEEWECLTWQPQVWDTTDEAPTTKAATSREGYINSLKERARAKDGYMNHMFILEPFQSIYSMSTIT